MVQWLLTLMAILVSGVALVRVRRLTKRLDHLTESYWELRYECGQLRSRLDRFDPLAPDGQAAVAPKRGGATQSFVPLSSLKPRQ